MSKIATASKFSVLKIYDDSSCDEDGFKAAPSNKKPNANKKAPAKMPNVVARGPNARKFTDGLVVHEVPQSKPKNNKKNKVKIIDDATGLVVQDADENYNAEKRYQEQLREALRESQNTQDALEEKKNQPVKTQDEVAIEAIEAQLRKGGQIGTAAIREEMEKLRQQLQIERNAAAAAKADSEKYKARYKKIVELFRDAEVMEKGEIAQELQKSRKMERELSEEVVQLRADLERARSRLTEYENKRGY